MVQESLELRRRGRTALQTGIPTLVQQQEARERLTEEGERLEAARERPEEERLEPQMITQ